MNSERFLLVTTFAAQPSVNGIKELVIPNDGRIIVSIHAYTPYRFSFYNDATWDLKTWNSVHTLGELEQPYDDNIVYTFHFYEPFLFTHQSAKWVENMPKEKRQFPGNIDEYRETANRIQCYGSGIFAEGLKDLGTSYSYQTSIVNVFFDIGGVLF